MLKLITRARKRHLACEQAKKVVHLVRIGHECGYNTEKQPMIQHPNIEGGSHGDNRQNPKAKVEQFEKVGKHNALNNELDRDQSTELDGMQACHSIEGTIKDITPQGEKAEANNDYPLSVEERVICQSDTSIVYENPVGEIDDYVRLYDSKLVVEMDKFLNAVTQVDFKENYISAYIHTMLILTCGSSRVILTLVLCLYQD